MECLACVWHVREFCKNCYEENTTLLGRDVGKNVTDIEKITTFCSGCKGNLCLNCFN